MAVASLTLGANSASANDNLVVYIECRFADGSTSQGSGVVVSEEGHILTARHVVADSQSCEASVGNRSLPKRDIFPSVQSRKIDNDLDAFVMEFGRGSDEEFDFAPVCALSQELKEKDVIAKGFHSTSRGMPSATAGVLSTTDMNFHGIVEMDAATVSGKSGGPVFLKGTDNVLGIVVGAEFTELGIVKFHGMLAIEAFMSDLDMLDVNNPCVDATDIDVQDGQDEDSLPTTVLVVGTDESGTDQDGSTVIWDDPDLNTGFQRLSRGSHHNAIDAFTKAIEGGSEWAGLIGRGHAHRALGQLELAINDFSTAIEADPSRALVFVIRGNAYSEQKRHQQAIEDYSAALAIDPSLAIAFNNRGVIYATVRQHDRALGDFNEAIALNETQAAFFHNRGLTHQALEDHGAGKEDFARVFALDPDTGFDAKPVRLECPDYFSCQFDR